MPNAVITKVNPADGAIGWGEAASAPVMTGETLESIVCAVHYLEPALREALTVGRPIAAA